MRVCRTLKRIGHLSNDEAGGTVAELAILIPFLIVMVAAVTELGRFFQSYSTLAKSTRASARYLSKVAYDEPYLTRAKNVALCGKTECGQCYPGDEDCEPAEDPADPVVNGLLPEHIVITAEYPAGGEGNPINVTVSIDNYTFQPIFDIGALLNSETFSLALPVRPSTSMYYMWTEPAGGGEG